MISSTRTARTQFRGRAQVYPAWMRLLLGGFSRGKTSISFKAIRVREKNHAGMQFLMEGVRHGETGPLRDALGEQERHSSHRQISRVVNGRHALMWKPLAPV